MKQFFDFSINPHFINFFIGCYETRHLKDYLKEFIRNYKDPLMISKILTCKNLTNKQAMIKKCLSILGKSFYTVGMYEESANFYSYVLENIDKYDKEAKLNLLNSLIHFDIEKSDVIRRQVDETVVDLSADHINSLLNEVFGKFKKNQNEKNKNKKKKKKIIKYPKNFDIKKPGPMPDPERWLPKLQRKKFRNIAKNKLAYQGASADNNTTTSNQLDRNKK